MSELQPVPSEKQALSNDKNYDESQLQRMNINGQMNIGNITHPITPQKSDLTVHML
jgi:hypothetical protein